MTFLTPWILLALTALPLLWWLLRVTPPAPRRQPFPAVRLLMGLPRSEETSARTPLWLLALRVLAAGLIIVGLAGPVADESGPQAGSGPVVLVIDNGWASAADWPQRMQAANAILDRAARTGRPVALLATAPDEAGTAPKLTPLMPAADLLARLPSLKPEPWPTDRAGAAAALRRLDGKDASIRFIADGLAGSAADVAFAHALTAAGPVSEICCGATPPRLLLPPRTGSDRLVARVAQLPQPAPTHTAVLAQTGDGRTLARAELSFAPGQTEAEASFALPPEVQSRIARLSLEGPSTAGSVFLIDEGSRRRPVGLVLTSDQGQAEAPFLGPFYYVRRALAPYAEIREADLQTLLRGELSVLILPDRVLPPGPERDALQRWVENGGLLVRFAGPQIAEEGVNEAADGGAPPSDPLLPVRLIGGDRELGGAMSWSKPAGLAPFPDDSPFTGLPVPHDVLVNRQVLAEPSAGLASHTWARLADGTPLVTEATRGRGRVVLFHVTANADWSNLPLSGLFVDMLRRLVAVSAGVIDERNSDAVLAPLQTLDGYGVLGKPPPTASGLSASALATTVPSPSHPPGFYGPEASRRSLNLGTAIVSLVPAAPVAGARQEALGTQRQPRAFGPALIAAACVLLIADLAISLLLRGLLRRGDWRRQAAALVLAAGLAGLVHPAWADALEHDANPALATRLGYIATGDPQVDQTSKEGLEGLSEFVNARTAATLAEPDPVTPGSTDLSFYPLLYWPITASASTLSPAETQALNDFMARGGILLIDTQDSGSGEGFAPGADAALRRVAAGLNVPALAPLTVSHVLARAFYLLRDYPGRYDGSTVWVQRDEDRTNDSVSPVVIGGNDWAAAWAVDAEGNAPFAVIPGGDRQRQLAFRFGVNLVMYALTGNYKGDQVHVPAILQRLGQ
ncbi:MAG TPA: DUF4159 domain-containing protein [Acetobacteraceae bacterium]|nr:DUF4159 domain-containing protein [Acetobacteraceae bacterium]